jgi:hypothetical protein
LWRQARPALRPGGADYLDRLIVGNASQVEVHGRDQSKRSVTAFIGRKRRLLADGKGMNPNRW